MSHTMTERCDKPGYMIGVMSYDFD